MLEANGLRWSVVESVPVHEEIKLRAGEWKTYICNYQETIRNLGRCGIDTVCYNFMPVLDWSRTNLEVQFRDGSITTLFKAHVFAAFDLYILKRPSAYTEYSEAVIEKARVFFNSLDEKQLLRLRETVLLGFPGSKEMYTLEKLTQAINRYAGIDAALLRENLRYFLQAIIPIAEASSVLMAIHPDDPPWSLLGLPRIVSTQDDIKFLLGAVDSPSNGLTLCTGSLGAGINNNLCTIADRFASRINFIHLRNVFRNADGDFSEENHLEGDIDLYRVMKSLILEQNRRVAEGRRDSKMPIRPDHGHLTNADRILAAHRGKDIYPGYSLFGRMRGMAELRGLELGIRRSLETEQYHCDE